MIKKYIQFINEASSDMWDDLYKKIGTDKYTESVPDLLNINRISVTKSGKVLDVGVGDGSNSKYFLQKGFDVYGIDVSKVALQRMTNYTQKGHWIEHDVTKKLPFENKFFDVIFSRLSIHYFDDEQTSEIIKEFRRVIKDDGLLFISVKVANVGNINTGKVMRTKDQWEEIISEYFGMIEMNEVVRKPYDYDPAPSNMLEIYAKPELRQKIQR